MIALRALLLALGVALLCGLVASNDPAEILRSIRGLSWRFGVILFFPAILVTFFDTLGWRFAFLEDRVAFGTLLRARLAGEAFNLTTPTALGGEAVKAWLLRAHVPVDESVPAIVAAKTTITIAQGIFLMLGIVLAVMYLDPTSALLRGMLWLLVIEVVALGVFVVVQIRGMFAWGRWLLERLGFRAVRWADTIQRIDRGLARFYRDAPLRLLLSIAFHFVAWVLGAVEVYVILRFLGVEVSLTTATVIEALATGVRFATFMIPASLGALEGSYVATFAAFGLSSTSALSFGLTRRFREIAWIARGFVLFAAMRTDRPGDRSPRAPDPRASA